MQQVAERAGVAMSSVSRVVSGHPDVSKVMRNRVLDAVAALGYEPDLLAQSLRRGATMTVGFVVGNIANPLFASIALGAELRLRNAGYTMLLANSIDDPSLDRTHIRLFAQRRVDGLMLSITDETDVEMHRVLQRAHRPTVLVDRDIPELHASAVLTDNAGGIELAAGRPDRPRAPPHRPGQRQPTGPSGPRAGHRLAARLSAGGGRFGARAAGRLHHRARRAGHSGVALRGPTADRDHRRLQPDPGGGVAGAAAGRVLRPGRRLGGHL